MVAATYVAPGYVAPGYILASTTAGDRRSLSPGAIVEMYELDLTALGGTRYYLHSGTNELLADLVWQGNTYIRFPIVATGFEINAKGLLPRPTVKVSNIGSQITALLKQYADMVGAKFTRRRTFVKYLDSINFINGNVLADPTAGFPDDIFYVNRKTTEELAFVEFELVSSLDLTNVRLPRRQMMQNLCTWQYKSGVGCTYAGGAVADINDNPVGSPAYNGTDACGKRLTSCQIRFGTFAVLPYGGFPGVGTTQW